MYAIKMNEIKTDQGELVRPIGYPPGFWPSGTEYTEAYSNMRALMASLNLQCFYAKLNGNVFELFNCFNTEAEASTFLAQFQQLGTIFVANKFTAENDPTDLDALLVGALKYMRLRNKVNFENFGIYPNAFEPQPVNLDTVDLTSFTKYDL
jgi:hypothetical protein